MKKLTLSLATGLFAAFCASSETNAAAPSAASEVRTFRLQYAAAAEVAEQINQLMSREVGPGGDSSYFQGTISSTDMHLLLQAFDDDSDLKTFANPKIIDDKGQDQGRHPRVRDGR